ncbi:MAG TPA: glycosyl transferase family 1 [Acidimicrobiaceae bacterium]|nr:glycosyl transferase family 1 [Acidimicrobiaceae bacterium]HCB36987.1 glycosyl transferase family 1 [Acidimicrobiaceae bacterium]
MPQPDRLRIAYLTYRGHPFTGGQGVYTRHISRQLKALGHHVEVFSGPPYPPVDDDIVLTKLPSLDLYRSPDPFRTPRLREFTDRYDVLEYALTATASFAEPLTFSLRAHRRLIARRGEFDVVHDNQCLGYGIDRLRRAGMPVMATIHHPITVDRRVEVDHAPTWRKRLALRRFYAFTRMQARVARRLERIVTVSASSRDDIVADMGVAASRVHVVNVGVDTDRFRPLDDVVPVRGRVMTTASADVAMKGLVFLLEAVAKLRTADPDVHLVVVGRQTDGSAAARRVAELGLDGCVEFVSGVSDERLAEMYGEAEVAVVPSLYEGFSLPAAEAMACGRPLVATTGGALPEVTGPDGESCLAVPPGDADALAAAIGRVLEQPDLRAALGTAARRRVRERFTWRQSAAATADHYRALLASTDGVAAERC